MNSGPRSRPQPVVPSVGAPASSPRSRSLLTMRAVWCFITCLRMANILSLRTCQKQSVVFPFTLCPCLAEHSSCLNGVYPRNDDGVAPTAPRVRCCRPAACFPFHGSPPALGVPRAPGVRKPPHARAHAVFRPPARHSVCPLKPRARLLLSSGNSSSGLSLALSPSASSLCSASALRDMPGRLVSRPLPPTAPSLCPAPQAGRGPPFSPAAR